METSMAEFVKALLLVAESPTIRYVQMNCSETPCKLYPSMRTAT